LTAGGRANYAARAVAADGFASGGAMRIDLTGQVAIVTGAGGGLGRAHALLLAERGAKVVVNDLGSATDGRGGSVSAAESVVREIEARGGQAVANGASVTDWKQIEDMVAATMERWGRVDILVNNAGILRDKTFAKMSLDDFRAVVDVHLMGAVNCTKAVWEIMRRQSYGRIVMTTSSSGLYGNFGQSNYGAAKLALVGFMQTLGLEGAKYNVHVNCLAPTAATRMLEGLLPKEELDLLEPGVVSPALLALVGKDAPNRTVLCAGAGAVEQAHITLTRGIFVGQGADAPEQILSRLKDISDRTGELIPENGMTQGAHELAKAGYQRAKGTS
jgi:NAD(P)-dependent dehydrogenase (short-subunit alcohol dehydrogenase family)